MDDMGLCGVPIDAPPGFRHSSLIYDSIDLLFHAHCHPGSRRPEHFNYADFHPNQLSGMCHFPGSTSRTVVLTSADSNFPRLGSVLNLLVRSLMRAGLLQT